MSQNFVPLPFQGWIIFHRIHRPPYILFIYSSVDGLLGCIHLWLPGIMLLWTWAYGKLLFLHGHCEILLSFVSFIFCRKWLRWAGDMWYLISHFPPKHLGEKNVGCCGEAGCLEDMWRAATFLLLTTAAWMKLVVLWHLHHPSTCGGPWCGWCCSVLAGCKSSEDLASPSGDFCSPQLTSREDSL